MWNVEKFPFSEIEILGQSICRSYSIKITKEILIMPIKRQKTK